ncbi:MAG: hypothetical protein ACI89L_002298 [Phycisphaerales bacterium]|jgi:hypothetical protein
MRPDRANPNRDHRTDAAALALATALALGVPAMAQDSEPLIIGQRERLVFFGLERVEGEAEAYWRYRLDESDPAAGPSIRDTESEFRESVSIFTEGYLGNPNLAKLTLDLSLRLTQEEIDSDSLAQSQRTSETFAEYDVSVLVLEKSDTPLTVYSRRSETLLDRQFADSLDSTTTEHGARLQLRYEAVPMQLSYFHREQVQTGRFSGTDFRLEQDTLTWQGRTRPVGGHRVWWDYSYSSVDESGQIRLPNTFDRHDAFLNHTLDFGAESRNNLRSSFRFYQETGEFPVDRLRWNEILRLRHTKHFETRYDYLFDRQERPDSTQNSYRGSAGFRHELYDSLATTGRAGASRLTLDEDNFESTEQFADLGVEYRKLVPLGRILATIDLDYSSLDDSDRGGSLNVTDESHTFGASGFITLGRRNILPASVVVTDATGVFVYVEGADYTVRVFADRTEIQRVLGGNIADGQTVLVDYEIGPEPASETETVGSSFTLRYRIDEGPLKGLSPFVRYRDQRQDRTSDLPLGTPGNDVRDLVVGVDYDLGRLSLSAEHQKRDSTLSPFDQTRLEGRFTQRFGRGNSLIASVYYQDTDRYEEDLRSEVFNATTRWNTRLSDRLQTGVVGTYRVDSDSDGTDTEAFDLELDLLWRYRLTTVFCNARTSFVNSDQRDNTSQTLTVGVRRKF